MGVSALYELGLLRAADVGILGEVAIGDVYLSGPWAGTRATVCCVDLV